MFGFLFEVCSTIIGAVFPIYRTWQVVRSRKTTQLVPLAKYWSVFGFFIIACSAADFLYISYLIPCYSFFKFASVVYIACDHEKIFDKTLSPLMLRYEPRALSAVSWAANIGVEVARKVCNSIVQFAIASATARKEGNGPAFTNGIFSAVGTNRAHVIECFEVQDENDVFYEEDDRRHSTSESNDGGRKQPKRNVNKRVKTEPVH